MGQTTLQPGPLLAGVAHRIEIPMITTRISQIVGRPGGYSPICRSGQGLPGEGLCGPTRFALGRRSNPAITEVHDAVKREPLVSG